MFGSRRSWQDVNGSACRRMQRASRKEEAISIHTAAGLILAHYEKVLGHMCFTY